VVKKGMSLIGVGFIVGVMMLVGCAKKDDILGPTTTGGGDPPPTTGGGTTTNGPGTFTSAPMGFDVITEIIALGNMSPPGHTLPTDHTYWRFSVPSGRATVYAPGTGTITNVTSYASTNGYAGQIQTITVQVTSTFSYVLDHLILTPGISTGTKLTGGQALGTTEREQTGNLDFGVVNTQLTRTGLAQPLRYSDKVINGDSPMKFYQDPLKSQVYAKVTRAGSEKDGKMDYDVAGRLVGAWFHESAPPTPGIVGPEDKALVFAYDVLDPLKIQLSVSGYQLTMAGAFGVQGGAIVPVTVTSASGKIGYQLYSFQGVLQGLLMVQMQDDTHIKVETFNGNTATTAEFTSNAKNYIR